MTNEITLAEIQARCVRIEKEKGFADQKRAPSQVLMLCVTELAEAMEEVRLGREPYEEYETEDKRGLLKPEGIPAELGDCIIRILAYMGSLGVDMTSVINKKLDYNETREHMHGVKL